MKNQHNVNKIILKKMLDYCNDIKDYMNQVNASYEVYLSNKMFRVAVDMSILQIGELTKHLTDDFKEQHQEITWHKIKGLRNVYVHEYEKIDFNLAWKTLTENIPELKAQLEQILATEDNTNDENNHA